MSREAIVVGACAVVGLHRLDGHDLSLGEKAEGLGGALVVVGGEMGTIQRVGGKSLAGSSSAGIPIERGWRGGVEFGGLNPR